MRRDLLVPGLMLAALLSTTTASAAVITFKSDSVLLGDRLEIPIEIVGAKDLILFDFNITFDPAVLSFVDAIEGTFLNKAGATFFFVCPDSSNAYCSLDPTLTVTNILLAPTPGVDGFGTLATLIFTPVGTGNANLDLPNFTLFDSLFFDIGTTPQFGDISVTSITPVPEPSTLGLLGVGLAALARRLRRKAPVAT